MTTKVLGQVATSSTTETDLYEVPVNTETVVSSLVICNRAAVQGSYRVSVSVGGGATQNKDYLYYDIPAPPNLVTVQHNGRRVDAVAQVTKYGDTFVLDRKTGAPLFPIEYRKAPASTRRSAATTTRSPSTRSTRICPRIRSTPN